MPKDLQSIEDLIKPLDESRDDETVQGKFNKKQTEIKTKETERLTEEKANSLGVSYVNLSGFPISPEAIALIEEEKAKTLGLICFFYDGANVRLGTTDPENKKAESKTPESTQGKQQNDEKADTAESAVKPLTSRQAKPKPTKKTPVKSKEPDNKLPTSDSSSNTTTTKTEKNDKEK